MKEHLELILGLKKLKEEVKENMKSEGETEKECRAGDGAPIYIEEQKRCRRGQIRPHHTAPHYPQSRRTAGSRNQTSSRPHPHYR